MKPITNQTDANLSITGRIKNDNESEEKMVRAWWALSPQQSNGVMTHGWVGGNGQPSNSQVPQLELPNL